MEHDIVWEEHNGPIPEGYEVHHRDENKRHNKIENLELLTSLEHKRIHGGCIRLPDGSWLKPCRECGVTKPVDTAFYVRKDGITSACRECSIKRSVADKKRRKQRSVEQGASA